MKTIYECGCETDKDGHGRLCEEHGAPMKEREYTKDELKAHGYFRKKEDKATADAKKAALANPDPTSGPVPEQESEG